jgi:Isocitrate lyase
MNKAFNKIETVEEYLSSKRWSGIKRDYTANNICSLRPCIKLEHTLSEIGSELLFNLLHRKDSWVSGLGAATAQQALQMFHLDYEIIYISGWQISVGEQHGCKYLPGSFSLSIKQCSEFCEKN